MQRPPSGHPRAPGRVRTPALVSTAFAGGGLLALALHVPAGANAEGAARPAVAAARASSAPPPVESPAAEGSPSPPLAPELPVLEARAPDGHPALPAAESADKVPSEQPSPDRTPLGEDEAAVHLARAWRSVAGADPTPETLALLWAQWAHETGRGKQMRGYNFAGIKGNGPGGDSFVAWTREVTASPQQRLRDTFRAYSTPEGGAQDYVRLLSSRYPAAFRAAVRGDVKRFVRALDLGGYFTDSDRAYSRALSSLARECHERAVPRRALEVVARGALAPAAEPTAI